MGVPRVPSRRDLGGDRVNPVDRPWVTGKGGAPTFDSTKHLTSLALVLGRSLPRQQRKDELALAFLREARERLCGCQRVVNVDALVFFLLDPH